ncbi:MAG TPA: hypothetical protein VGD98_05340 [Ktedonobacteraceae bacterium]
MKLNLEKQKSRLLAKKEELEQSMAGLTEAHPTPVSVLETHEGSLDHQEDMATDFLEMQNEQSILYTEHA